MTTRRALYISLFSIGATMCFVATLATSCLDMTKFESCADSNSCPEDAGIAGSSSAAGSTSESTKVTGGASSTTGGSGSTTGGSNAVSTTSTGGLVAMMASTGGSPPASTTSTGGNSSTGTVSSTGGSSVVPMATGGSALTSVAGTGGANATGGTSSTVLAGTGGAKATGGTPATGGKAATGGALSTGGSLSTGGTTNTGDAGVPIPCQATGIRIAYTSSGGQAINGAGVSINSTGSLGATFDMNFTSTDDLDPSPQTFVVCATTAHVPTSFFQYILMDFTYSGGSVCNTTNCGNLSQFAIWINGNPVSSSTFSYFPACASGCKNVVSVSVSGANYQ